jgi:hypothetical protein
VTLAAVALLVALAAPAAHAGTLLVLGAHGHVRRERVGSLGPAAPIVPVVAPEHMSARRAHSAGKAPTPASVLVALHRAGALSAARYARERGDLRQAGATLARLTGTRHAELAAVVGNLDAIAAARELTAARLAPLFLTLERNRQWWSSAPIPAPDQRVSFAGSQLVWEYYPGQGIELQPLASFGVADGLYTAGRAHYAQMESLLAELTPLAVPRAGGLAWEYYFAFDGGRPPWISAMTEGTALEALTRAYRATHQTSYLSLAGQLLPAFGTAPPSGVGVAARQGRRFLQYSFAPGVSIINAFLQTLIGLDDYATYSHDPTAQALFAAGNAEAEAEVPSFDTGAWSLYQPGVEDDLSYHELVTGFLQQLCRRTQAPVYCVTAQHFTADLTTPPVLVQETTAARVRHPFVVRFHLSKISHVGIVITRGEQTVLATSAHFGYGERDFSVPALARRGTYGLRLAATDLNGNFARITGTLAIR